MAERAEGAEARRAVSCAAQVGREVRLRVAPRLSLRARHLVRLCRADRRVAAAPARCARDLPPTTRSDGRRRRLDADEAAEGDRPVHGWLVFDKPVGMTSTQVVGRVRRAVRRRRRPAMAARSTRWRPACCRSRSARRPRPSPMSWTAPKTLPLHRALGRGARDRRRRGRGHRDQRRPARPRPRSRRRCRASPATIMQVPPAYLGDQGRRRARLRPGARRRDGRAGSPAPCASTRSTWSRSPTPTTRSSRSRRGKGAYMRSLARDLARALGTVGHLSRAAPDCASGRFTRGTRDFAG